MWVQGEVRGVFRPSGWDTRGGACNGAVEGGCCWMLVLSKAALCGTGGSARCLHVLGAITTPHPWFMLHTLLHLLCLLQLAVLLCRQP